MSEWISVKDRLPEREGKYLVVVEGDKTNNSYVIIRNFYNGNFIKFEYPFENRKFTYWMPLPEPPKGENEK